mgnify:CR=1 FL=1
MTVKALPGVGIYHLRVRENGTTDEHVAQPPLRRTQTAYVLYCAPCDAVSVIRRDVDSGERRNADTAISDDPVFHGRSKTPHPVLDIADVLDGRGGAVYAFDPLVLAREDGETRIPALLPSGHVDRRALVRSLRVPRA